MNGIVELEKGKKTINVNRKMERVIRIEEKQIKRQKR